MLEVARDLCSSLTGSRCNDPKLTDWVLVNPSQSSIGVDVADLATGGVGAVVPVNARVYGSYFSSGLERRRENGGMSTSMKGMGVGAGVGAGWGIPFVGAKGVGKIPDGVKKKVIESVGKIAQGQVEKLATDLVFEGVSGGTRLIAGPDSNGDLEANDFHNGYATVIGLGANFAVNGVSVGVVLMSKRKPIVTSTDLIHTTAIGLMGGVGLATSLDIEASEMIYRLSFLG